VTRGQLVWHQTTPYTLIGRAEGTDAAAGIARSFSCGSNCCLYYWDYFYLTPGLIQTLDGGSASFIATKSVNDCMDRFFTYDGVQPPSWTSTDPSVATVNSFGFTNWGGAEGTTTIIGNFTGKSYDYVGTRCRWTPLLEPASARVNINPPDHVKVVKDVSNFSQCLTGSALLVRSMTMQYVDFKNRNVQTNYFSQELPFSNLTPNTCQAGAYPAPAGCFPAGQSTACPNCGKGQFNDSIAVDQGLGGNFCSSVDPAKLRANCGFSLTGTWAMCDPRLVAPNPIWTSNRTIQGFNIVVGGNNTQWAPGTMFH
jgi:hypothetical protein